MRIGVASRRHQLRVSRIIPFHRLLNCARKLGAEYDYGSFQGNKWVSPPLNKFFLQKFEVSHLDQLLF